MNFLRVKLVFEIFQYYRKAISETSSFGLNICSRPLSCSVLIFSKLKFSLGSTDKVVWIPN